MKRLPPLPETFSGLLVSHPETILDVIDELGFYFVKRTTYLHFCFNVFYRTRSFWCFGSLFLWFERFFDLGVDGFDSFPFWFDFCTFLAGVSCIDFFTGIFSSVFSSSKSSSLSSSSSSSSLATSYIFFLWTLTTPSRGRMLSRYTKEFLPFFLLTLHLPPQLLRVVC